MARRIRSKMRYSAACNVSRPPEHHPGWPPQSAASPHDSSNTPFVNAVIDENVTQTMDQIRAMSPMLKDLEDNGQIQIKGGVYKLDSGQVEWI